MPLSGRPRPRTALIGPVRAALTFAHVSRIRTALLGSTQATLAVPHVARLRTVMLGSIRAEIVSTAQPCLTQVRPAGSGIAVPSTGRYGIARLTHAQPPSRKSMCSALKLFGSSYCGQCPQSGSTSKRAPGIIEAMRRPSATSAVGSSLVHSTRVGAVIRP